MLLKLKEERNKAKEKFHIHQQRIKRWFDKHVVGDKQFQVGDLVLKWDKESEARENILSFKRFGLVCMRLLRKLEMLHTDFNLYKETWKTSLLMLLS